MDASVLLGTGEEKAGQAETIKEEGKGSAEEGKRKEKQEGWQVKDLGDSCQSTMVFPKHALDILMIWR